MVNKIYELTLGLPLEIVMSYIDCYTSEEFLKKHKDDIRFMIDWYGEEDWGYGGVRHSYVVLAERRESARKNDTHLMPKEVAYPDPLLVFTIEPKGENLTHRIWDTLKHNKIRNEHSPDGTGIRIRPEDVESSEQLVNVLSEMHGVEIINYQQLIKELEEVNYYRDKQPKLK